MFVKTYPYTFKKIRWIYLRCYTKIIKFIFRMCRRNHQKFLGSLIFNLLFSIQVCNSAIYICTYVQLQLALMMRDKSEYRQRKYDILRCDDTKQLPMATYRDKIVTGLKEILEERYSSAKLLQTIYFQFILLVFFLKNKI